MAPLLALVISCGPQPTLDPPPAGAANLAPLVDPGTITDGQGLWGSRVDDSDSFILRDGQHIGVPDSALAARPLRLDKAFRHNWQDVGVTLTDGQTLWGTRLTAGDVVLSGPSFPKELEAEEARAEGRLRHVPGPGRAGRLCLAKQGDATGPYGDRSTPAVPRLD